MNSENVSTGFFQGEGFQGEGAGEDGFAYKAISRAAVLSLVLGIAGLLAWIYPLLTILAILAAVCAFVAFRNLRAYPSELTGKWCAVAGAILGGGLAIGAPVRHTYVYYTEVPEGYERVSFSVLKSPTGAPDVPTNEAMQLDGKKIFIKGYIHSTSLSSMNAKTFVLVPDWATCCFGGQPPLTHMIEVRILNDKYASRSYRQHSLSGTFHVIPQMKYVEGLTGVYYVLEADDFN